MIPNILNRLTQFLFPMHNLNGTSIQDLPDELAFEIFSYLSLTEIVHLYSECLLFHNTVARIVVSSMRNLPKRITCEIENIKKEMQLSSASADSSRFDFSTVLTYLRCTLTEVALLRATVGHYIKNEAALGLLLEPLGQILHEFHSNFVTLRDSSVRKIIRADYSSPGTAKWNNFLKTFDSTLRPKIEELSGIIVPVEVIIADLLHCSVSANLQSNFSCLYQGDKYSLNMFFQLKDIRHKGIPPNFNSSSWTEIDKQNRFVKYLRSLIRYENRAFVCKYMKELNELENLIVFSGPNTALDNIFEKLQNAYSKITLSPFKTTSRFLHPSITRYNEIYYRANDMDVSKTGITICLKTVTDKKYFPLDYNYRTSEQLYLLNNETDIPLLPVISDTKLGTLICLSEVPSIDQALTYAWSTTNEYCDINVCVQYDTLFTLNSLDGKEAEIIFNKSNNEITFMYKEYEIILM